MPVEHSQKTTVEHKKITHYKACLRWLSAKRNQLGEMTDRWGHEERKCLEEWTYYLDKVKRYHEAVEADFNDFCADLTDDQRVEVLREVKAS